MISLTTNRGADYLVIVVSVESFVEGCILNAVHHVSVFGIHRTSSLLSRSVRHHRAAFFVVRFTLPTMIVYLCTGIISSVNNANLSTGYWCLLYSFTGTFFGRCRKRPASARGAAGGPVCRFTGTRQMTRQSDLFSYPGFSSKQNAEFVHGRRTSQNAHNRG